MRYTVILVPEEEGRISAAVPAMPGCVSNGRSRDEALANVREAIGGWIETEAEHGRGPLKETPSAVAAGVTEALEIIDEMRQAGDIPTRHGYQLELVTLEVQQPAVA